MLLKSFVYTDAKRKRMKHKERAVRRKETKGRREMMEIEREKQEKKKGWPVCVLVGGN